MKKLMMARTTVQMVAKSSSKLLIAIVGPTAVGKSALALQLAAELDTEILSADSRQCYRELNIGTGKPSAQELSSITHHFINSHSIVQTVSAGDYERYAVATLDTIFQQKDVAILCGGTGLYVNAALGTLSEMPAVNEEIVAATNAEYAAKGLEWLQAELKLCDPAYFESIDAQNAHRLLRGLSFFRSNGESISKYKNGVQKPRNFKVLKIGVTLPRPELYQKIEQRVAGMMAEGLAAEARNLAPIFPKKTLKTIGYSEFYDTDDNDEAIATKIMLNSRRYAKRQMTWFRADEKINWVAPDDLEQVKTLIKSIS